MNIAAIVMILIIVKFILTTINRFAIKDPVHQSVINGLDMAIVIGAFLWLLEFFGVINF